MAAIDLLSVGATEAGARSTATWAGFEEELEGAWPQAAVVSDLVLLRKIRAAYPELPVVFQGDQGDHLCAEDLGALACLLPSSSREEIEQAYRAAAGGLIGSTPALDALRQQIRLVARAQRTSVLIRGESGVGKEAVAQAIHDASPRRAGPFVAINCAALTEALLESELFGHERGAFSGAFQRKLGLFEVASGGTLLLDEIGELSPALQAKLLRALQERRFYRVGGTTPVEVDVRILSSTNRDLETAVLDGSFRRDLYYRLNVIQIAPPPLRARSEDAVVLARHFLHRVSDDLGRSLQGFTPEAEECLREHPWPGNVRELMNTVEAAAVLATSERIDAQDLRFCSLQLEPGTAASNPAQLGRTLAEVEQAHIERVLDDCEGNRSRAARRLGIHRTTLLKKLRDSGLSPVVSA